MFRKLTEVFFVILFTAFLLSSCSKEEEEINLYNGRTTAVFNPDLEYGTMTDQDGNIYKTVTIGTQTWMAENLRTTKYNDGTEIPNVTDSDEWSDLTTGAYCNYNNTSTDIGIIATYGRLYNWYAIGTGKLAPEGWHITTDAEWIILTNYLEDAKVAGVKLKETGITHWNCPDTGATNETGFTALPGGYCSVGEEYFNFEYGGYWWYSTSYSTTHAWYWYMYCGMSVFRSNAPKNSGFSVRCVMD